MEPGHSAVWPMVGAEGVVPPGLQGRTPQRRCWDAAGSLADQPTGVERIMPQREQLQGAEAAWAATAHKDGTATGSSCCLLQATLLWGQ